MAELHGADPNAAMEDYESPEEYADQGDDRMVRALSFIYTVQTTDPSGAPIITTNEVKSGAVVTIEQIGSLALRKGEESHSFYTSDEREAVEAGRDPDAVGTGAALASGGSVSDLGEYELAEHIKNENLTVQQTIDLAGGDKDLAHRLLQAENIATDGEPRKGVETGLTAIIEG